MSEKKKKTGTFLVKILDQQNASWQGTVTWVEERQEQRFRSALELIKLIDGAIDENRDIEGGSHER